MDFREPGYRQDIEGLRGIAVSAVLAFHFFPAQFPGGFMGVDVFFVISGFLITGLIVTRLEERRFSFTEFYLARIRRLLPALILVLLVCAAAAWKLMLNGEHQLFGHHLAATTLFLSNWAFAREQGYFAPSFEMKPLGHLWSLAIEEQFYLLWPLFLWLAWKQKRLLLPALLLITASSLGANWNHRQTTLQFFSTWARLWELSLGGVIAVTLPRWQSFSPRIRDGVAATAAAFLLSGFIWGSNTTSSPLWLAIPTAGTALLIAAGPDAWSNRTWLRHPLLTGVGRVSYPLYLWHWPLLVFYRITQGGSKEPLPALVLLGLCLALALATHYGIEKPVKQFRIPARTTACASVLLLGFTYGLGAAIQGEYLRSSVQKASARYLHQDYFNGVSESTFWRGEECFLIQSDDRGFEKGHCTDKLFPKAPTVMLVGDSSSAYLSIGLKQHLKNRGINFILMAASGCAPVELEEKKSPCTAMPAYIRKKVAQLKPDALILFFHHTYYMRGKSPGVYEQKFQTYVAELAKSAKKVIVLGQIPAWSRGLAAVTFRNFIQPGLPIPRRTFRDVMPITLAADDKLKRLAYPAGVSYVSLKNLLCNDEGCLINVGPPHQQGYVVKDQHHLTAIGASFVAHSAVLPLLPFVR